MTAPTPDYFIGLMSGTSVDGIDAVLVDFSSRQTNTLATRTFEWNPQLRQQILNAIQNPELMSLEKLGSLDAELGDAFADAALNIVEQANLRSADITAIGSHGQTLFHAPNARPAFSLQAGDANRIASKTGITTVADFRRRDIAAGGQGAPLVPAFHRALFYSPEKNRGVLNIGGIANLTYLPADNSQVLGFDTGPGNVLMDAWIAKHKQLAFDNDGAWAQRGECSIELLERLLACDYFSLNPPKSTGRERFHLDWLESILQTYSKETGAENVQATLCEFTATSIANAIQAFLPETEELYVCGGGAHNSYLMQRLQALSADCNVSTTEDLGLEPDWVEATAFAWLARQTLKGKPGNIPSATGARHPVVLGAIYPA